MKSNSPPATRATSCNVNDPDVGDVRQLAARPRRIDLPSIRPPIAVTDFTSLSFALFIRLRCSVSVCGTFSRFSLFPRGDTTIYIIVHAKSSGEKPRRLECTAGSPINTFRLKRFDFVMQQISEATQPKGF